MKHNTAQESNTKNPLALAKKFKDADGNVFEKFDQLERETSQGPVIFIKDDNDTRHMLLWRGPDHEHGEGFSDVDGNKFTPVK